MVLKVVLFLWMFVHLTYTGFGQQSKNCLVDKVTENSEMTAQSKKNVLGTALQACCFDPLTGYFRDGYCHTNASDYGTHVVCAKMTEEFLTFTKTKGNDLSTPIPFYNFPGLQPGDQWCLCALRWKEAMQAGVAPPVILESTNIIALRYIELQDLMDHAFVAEIKDE